MEQVYPLGTVGAQLVINADHMAVAFQGRRIPLGEVQDLATVMEQLRSVAGHLPESTPRLTAEGIDREFRANDGFYPDSELWAQDSLSSWQGLSGPELFNRYQSHAETYVWGCNDFGQEPTYEGFRQWLCQLRDMDL